jgi:hypothetical protein
MSKQATLELSFYGPFAFMFLPDKVQICAPQCKRHLGSVRTDREENALCGRLLPEKGDELYEAARSTCRKLVGEQGDQSFEYKLESDDPALRSVRETTCFNPHEMILVDSSRRKPKHPEEPHPLHCYYRLEVPRPNLVVGLLPDPVAITETDLPSPPSSDTSRATAMRFAYFGFDSSQSLHLRRTHPQGGSTGIMSLSFNPPPSQNHAEVTFRYSHDGLFDKDRKDSEQCFERIRSLFPPLDSWKVSFFEGLRAPLPNHTGSDCKAPQLIFLSSQEMAAWKTRQ